MSPLSVSNPEFLGWASYRPKSQVQSAGNKPQIASTTSADQVKFSGSPTNKSDSAKKDAKDTERSGLLNRLTLFWKHLKKALASLFGKPKQKSPEQLELKQTYRNLKSILDEKSLSTTHQELGDFLEQFPQVFTGPFQPIMVKALKPFVDAAKSEESRKQWHDEKVVPYGMEQLKTLNAMLGNEDMKNLSRQGIVFLPHLFDGMQTALGESEKALTEAMAKPGFPKVVATGIRNNENQKALAGALSDPRASMLVQRLLSNPQVQNLLKILKDDQEVAKAIQQTKKDRKAPPEVKELLQLLFPDIKSQGWFS